MLSFGRFTFRCHPALLDGVYAAGDGERPVFYPVRPPDSKDVAAVAERVAVRVVALLEKRCGAVALDQGEPGLATIYGASITGRIETGPNAGQRLKTSGDFQPQDNSEERFESNGSLILPTLNEILESSTSRAISPPGQEGK